MPTCIPESPTFATASEQAVWERLRDQLGAEDILLANLHLTSEERDYEADLVVLMPRFGALVLEVKGGSVWYDDGWCQQAAGQTRWIDPVAQARSVKYALRTYVEQQAAWGSRTRVRWAHGVVTPYSTFPLDFSLPDLQRWALHDVDDQEHLITRVRENASKGDSQRPPEIDDVWAIADALAGRRQTTTYDVNADAADRTAQADRLTEQQALILSVTRLLNRVEVHGELDRARPSWPCSRPAN